MSLKEQLEAEIKDCRFHADLMSLKVKQFRSYDTALNVILAIASSGSIASWTIWDYCCPLNMKSQFEPIVVQ